MKDVDSETELKDAFRVLDAKGLGYIGTAEMQKICKVRALATRVHLASPQRPSVSATHGPLSPLRTPKLESPRCVH
jgi:hypothetical protein